MPEVLKSFHGSFNTMKGRVDGKVWKGTKIYEVVPFRGNMTVGKLDGYRCFLPVPTR